MRSAFAGNTGVDVNTGFTRGVALTGSGCVAMGIPPALGRLHGMMVGPPALWRIYSGEEVESPFGCRA